jgi:hypothetical protein
MTAGAARPTGPIRPPQAGWLTEAGRRQTGPAAAGQHNMPPFAQKSRITTEPTRKVDRPDGEVITGKTPKLYRRNNE